MKSTCIPRYNQVEHEPEHLENKFSFTQVVEDHLQGRQGSIINTEAGTTQQKLN